ncbi:MAG: hypothetical protein ALECFALPRED_005811 [Alectoria fallacina]|uniref:Aminoglycoside phosphotransferase domain-containing protein n=1 Tax=Alectoria fallacina TaxID=1903189 RepID=A0A8H3G0G4_9LECA|nr:MAG: hypothetical protein ALECFALPRED_005811 [Alectoria fallacina]
MALETHVKAGVALPKGWVQSEQETINEFFEEKVPAALKERAARNPSISSKSCSASECLQYAKVLMQGMSIYLVDHQGCNSYTLICPELDRIIQFRAAELSTKAIDEAKQMYGDLVAGTTQHNDFVLPVYTYNILPGQLHVWQKVSRGSFPLAREKRTIIDLAIFIATASHFPHPKARYNARSWTECANAAVKRLEQNFSLRQIAPAVYTELASLRARLHLLDILPAVLTHVDLGGQNIFVDGDVGTLTGVIDFEEARTEAFGINIFTIYENHVGSMEDGHWSPYDMPAGQEHPGLSVSEVLTKAFWDALWASTAPGLGRRDFEEAVGVALRVGIINRYFVRGMLDEIDLAKRVHVISLDYAKEILLYLRDTRR